MGAIHSTKISRNFGPKLNGSVRSNLKSFEKTGPPFEVVLFSQSDRSESWLNGSRSIWLKRAMTAQNCEIVFRFKSDTAPSTFSFLFLSFTLFIPICFQLQGITLVGKVSRLKSWLDPQNLILYLGQLLKILTCEHGILQILTWQALLIHLQLKFLAGIAMYNLCLLPY